tara:strand:- start:273 stop:2654 length:2382 start_codon:yes stop_codon:yes gene_type:complete
MSNGAPSKEESARLDKFEETLKNLSAILMDNLNINRENVDAINDSVKAAKGLADPYTLSASAAKEIKKSTQDIATLASKVAKDEDTILNRRRSSKDIAKDLAKSSKAEKSLLVEIAKTGELRNQRDKDGNKINNESTKILDDIIAGMRAQIDQAGDIDKALQKELDSALKIENAHGLSGKALEGINKLLGGAIPQLDEIRAGAQDQLAGLEKEGKLRTGLAGKMQGMGALMKSTGGILKANMLDPLVLMKAGFDFDKEATALQKNLAISATEAYGLNVTLSMAATNTGNMAIQGADASKAFGTLNDQLGIASTAIIGMVGEAAKMQKLLGLSDTAIGKAGKASLILGKSMEDIKLDIIDSTTSVRTQTGVALNYNKILEKTLNVSGQIAMQLGNNPKEIAKAVAQANALGMELEQVAKVGQSLLSFEQSIEAELEAELLTGKQLNLEKARLLALTGDYEALSVEIAEQAGTFTEYSAMNVIQQQKLAEAFGMSADEMSNMLIDQEAMGKTAEQLRAEGKEDIAQRIEARNAQEKFTDAVEKMKNIFADLVGGPVGGLLNMLTLALVPINAIVTSVSKLFSLFTGAKEEMSLTEGIMATMAVTAGILYGYSKKTAIQEGIIKGYQVAKTSLAAIKLGYDVASGKASAKEIRMMGKGLGRSIALTATKIFQTFAKVPFGLGIPLAIAAVVGMGALVSKFSKADDGVFEGGGYGKRALLDEGSITLFNDKDTILAGTKLNKADDMVSKPAGTVQTASPQPIQPVILQNEVVYDSHQSANYYNGPRSTEKSETGIHA